MFCRSYKYRNLLSTQVNSLSVQISFCANEIQSRSPSLLRDRSRATFSSSSSSYLSFATSALLQSRSSRARRVVSQAHDRGLNAIVAEDWIELATHRDGSSFARSPSLRKETRSFIVSAPQATGGRASEHSYCAIHFISHQLPTDTHLHTSICSASQSVSQAFNGRRLSSSRLQ